MDCESESKQTLLHRTAQAFWPKCKMNVALILLPLFCILLTGCSAGYKKENGKWAWVSWDEAVGRRVVFVEGAESSSFRVLRDSEYGADRNAVYHRNVRITNAEPAGF